MNAAHGPQRLYLRGVERTVQIDPSLPGLELAIQRRRGDAQGSHQRDERRANVLELVGRYANVVELLRDREGDAVSVVQGAPAGRKHHLFGALPGGFPLPSFRLDDLELRRTGENGEDPDREGELDGADPGGGLGHQRPPGPAGGMANRTNSESAGSWRPRARCTIGTSTWRLEPARIRRSRSPR